MYSLRKFFFDIRVEIAVISAICLSVVFALTSLVWTSPLIEHINLAFSLLFCLELSLRFAAADDHKKYWKSYSIDWIASIPWSWIAIVLVPHASIPLAWLRLLRLPRMLRLLRFINMSKSNVGRRMVYRLKKQLEKSFPVQLSLLLGFSVCIVLFFGIVFRLLGSDGGFGDPFFFSLITMINSGSVFEITPETGLFKGLTVILALFGVVVFNGALIAILVTRMTEYLDTIRDGRGDVMEKKHLVILGWHDVIPYLLRDLEVYCQNESETLTVVLQTDELNPELWELTKAYRGLDIILRRGSSYKQSDLEQLAIYRSRVVLALGKGSLFDHDSIVIKSFLTMNAMLDRGTREKKHSSPAVLLNLPSSVMSEHLTDFALPDQLTFDPFYYSAKILSSSVQNPVLGNVFAELFSFDGSEFYFLPPGKSIGLTCRNLVGTMDSVQFIGLIRNNEPVICPNPDERILENDLLILLSPTAVTARHGLAKDLQQTWNQNDIPVGINVTDLNVVPKRIAIIGANRKTPFLVEELIKAGHAILIVDNQRQHEFETWFTRNTGSQLPDRVEFKSCEFTHMDDIQEVLPLASIDRVVILADEQEDHNDAERVDADTLYKILKIRSLGNTLGVLDQLEMLAEIVSPDSEEAINKIPGVHFVIGTQILGNLLSSYMLEPKMELLCRQIVQRGGADIDVFPLTITDTQGTQKLRFDELSKVLYSNGKVLIGINRPHAEKNSMQMCLNPGYTSDFFVIHPGDEAIIISFNGENT